jgi:hypothetical protein
VHAGRLGFRERRVRAYAGDGVHLGSGHSRPGHRHLRRQCAVGLKRLEHAREGGSSGCGVRCQKPTRDRVAPPPSLPTP